MSAIVGSFGFAFAASTAFFLAGVLQAATAKGRTTQSSSRRKIMRMGNEPPRGLEGKNREGALRMLDGRINRPSGACRRARG